MRMNSKAMLMAYKLVMDCLKDAKEGSEELDGNYYLTVVGFIRDGLAENVSILYYYSEPEYAKESMAIYGEILGIILDGEQRENTSKSIVDSIIARLQFLAGGQVMAWVNVYDCTRHFGGHEEGGWYYNWEELKEAKYVPYEEAEKVLQELREEYGEGEGNIYSVLGGNEMYFRIESSRGESESKEVPHYE